MRQTEGDSLNTPHTGMNEERRLTGSHDVLLATELLPLAREFDREIAAFDPPPRPDDGPGGTDGKFNESPRSSSGIMGAGNILPGRA